MITYDPSREALLHPWRRPTVFKRAHAMAYHPRALGAEAARLAYTPFERDFAQRNALAEALLQAGFQDLTPFNDAKTGSQGYGAWRADDGLVLLAFRGTEPDELSDIASDLGISLVRWRDTAAQVHHGFADAALSLLPHVQTWLDGFGPRRRQLLVCGHSLGAAIATLVSTVVAPELLVTLGSPRVGDEAFARLLPSAHTQHTRLVHGCDLVTEVPPHVVVPKLVDLPYAHVGPATYIHATDDATAAPQVQADVDTDSPAIRDERNHARAAYLLHHAWRSGSVLVRDLADHAPINYVRAFIHADGAPTPAGQQR